LDSSIQVMNEIGVPLTKVLYIFNKVDLTGVNDALDKSSYLGLSSFKKHILPVSAKTGYNIDQLKNLISILIFCNENRSKTAEDLVRLVKR